MQEPSSTYELIMGFNLNLVIGIIVEDIEKYRRFKSFELITCQLGYCNIIALR